MGREKDEEEEREGPRLVSQSRKGPRTKPAYIQASVGKPTRAAYNSSHTRRGD